jgi:hypothetical protein
VGLQAGLDDVEKLQFLILPGLELRPLCRPASSQSLYRLSYPGFSLQKYILFVTHLATVCLSKFYAEGNLLLNFV